MSDYLLRSCSVPLGDCSADPRRSVRPVSDPLQVGVIHLQHEEANWCLVVVDVTELNTRDTLAIRRRAAGILGMDHRHLWIAFTHTHAGLYGYSCLDIGKLSDSIVSAARRTAAAPPITVDHVATAAVDTGNRFAVNRRGHLEGVGTFSVYQCQDCTDDGRDVNAAGWARRILRDYGAREADVTHIVDLPLDGWVDGWGQLLLFFSGSRPAAGVVRFNAHPVIVSSGYFKPHFSRDYCGVLCDELAAAWGCPFVFIQGPAGNQRTRHVENSIAQCVSFGQRLAGVLKPNTVNLRSYPLDRLCVRSKTVSCSLHEYLRLTNGEVGRRVRGLEEAIASNRPGEQYLKKLKELSEARDTLLSIKPYVDECGFVTSDELAAGSRDSEVAVARFGPVTLAVSSHELGNFFSRRLYDAFSPDTCITAAYVNGCDGYVLEPDDFHRGGYETIASVYTPANSERILRTAETFLKECTE